MKTYISPTVQVIHFEMEEVIATSILVDSTKSGNQQLSNEMDDWGSIWSTDEHTANGNLW